MNPAFSVIFLTTLIGLAQGLFMAVAFTHLNFSLNEISLDDSLKFFIYGGALSVLFLIAGLIASFFHLGHPERAWRSAAMWRTSWLSREVIALPLAMGSISTYTLMLYYKLDFLILTIGTTSITASLVVAMASIVFVFALFICTGMIYACVKFIQEWAHPLTVINYTLFGITSGLLLASVFSLHYLPDFTNTFVVLSLISLFVVLITRGISLLRNYNLKPISTTQSAIGVKKNKITQISSGANTGSFNTREFFLGTSRHFLITVRGIAILGTFVIPISLLLFYQYIPSQPLLYMALLTQYLGLIAERWFFFAQANHPQNIYYQNT